MIIIVLLPIFITCFSQNKVAQIDWEKDIEFLRIELPKKHKDFFFKRNKQDFDTGLDRILLQLDSLTDFDIALKFQQLVASFGDSHTQINWRLYLERSQIFPLIFYWFDNGIYAIEASEEYKSLLGTKIKSINGTQISVVIDSLSTLITIDNKAIVKSKIPNFISSAQILDYFDFDNNGVYEFEAEELNGAIKKYKITPSVIDKKYIGFNPDSLAYCWKNKNISFAEEYFEKVKIYYLKYNSCSRVSKLINSEKTISFKDYKKKVFETLKEKDVDKIIFDMRFNAGGSSYQGTRFIKKLSKLDEYNKKGKLFVVIGRKTFSSAVLNTLDFKKHTNAIIVGEETSGKPNHYGEVRTFELPNSKLKVYYSKKYFKNSKIDFNTIKPDIEIEIKFLDYKNGIDPTFKWIKKQ